MKFYHKFVIIIFSLSCSSFVSAQVLKSEDDVVNYLNNASSLDLIEGIYFVRSGNYEYWKAIVFNSSTGEFDYYDIDSKTRTLKPYCGRNETHLVRTSKYAYVYYAYVIINSHRYESSTHTFDSKDVYAHWNCGGPVEGNWHITLDLKNKVYPK